MTKSKDISPEDTPERIRFVGNLCLLKVDCGHFDVFLNVKEICCINCMGTVYIGFDTSSEIWPNCYTLSFNEHEKIGKFLGFYRTEQGDFHNLEKVKMIKNNLGCCYLSYGDSLDEWKTPLFDITENDYYNITGEEKPKKEFKISDKPRKLNI